MKATAVDLARRGRSVLSYTSGGHLPSPYQARDGWRCHDCGQRLRTYVSVFGSRRLRHRGAA